MSGAPALEVLGLAKRYGDTHAVDGVDLSLADGEVLSLVGPSGCGKSTMIRLITGLVTPDAGLVVLGGQEVFGPRTSVPPERRRIGVVFQDHSLFPHLDVEANIAFGLHGWPAARRRARVAEVLELVDLPGMEGRFPHELSGGERQRVGLARALAPEPAVICLDEPFASLDPALRQRIRTDTLRILAEAGAAALLVTHDQVEAMAMGDRVAVMASGRIRQVDVPERVYTQPTSRFVAAFLGEADFLPAELREGGLMTEVGPCPLPEGEVDDTVAGEVMVRPHEVGLVPDPASGDVVAAAEFQGGHILYEVRLESGRRLRALLPHTTRLDVGTPVGVRLSHGHPPAVLPPDRG